jgi:hypothetical protein
MQLNTIRVRGKLLTALSGTAIIPRPVELKLFNVLDDRAPAGQDLGAVADGQDL